MPMQRRVLAMAGVVGCAVLQGGCVVWDIRNDLRGVNGRLEHVESQLAALDKTNQQLDELKGQMESLKVQLVALQTSLQVMPSMDATLVKLDGHLAGLRGTIESIDKTIPFLSLSPKEEEKPEGAAGEHGAPTDDSMPPSPDSTGESATPSKP
ncbi:MAG: hypothetical protein IPK69_08635 [Phycisphaerales bacterium]|nr:MAG: hypothetical protein IPK69_08635 [Phycisphaerales bacterium]